MTHTPGQWVAGIDGSPIGSAQLTITSPQYRRSHDASHVIAYLLHPTRDDTQANARLMAAAPDLLAALKPFADLIENPDAFPDGTHQWWVDTADVRRAVSAIAQAEGGG